MAIHDRLIEGASQVEKNLVLSEGHDPRVVAAANKIIEKGLAKSVIVLGTEDEIYNRLMEKGESKPPGAKLRRMFDDGIDVQMRYIRYFREMGILYEPEGWDEKRGVEVIDAQHGIIGGIDVLINTPDEIVVPVEMKAYNSRLFQAYKRKARIEHVHQLQFNILMFKDGYTALDALFGIFECLVKSSLCQPTKDNAHSRVGAGEDRLDHRLHYRWIRDNHILLGYLYLFKKDLTLV